MRKIPAASRSALFSFNFDLHIHPAATNNIIAANKPIANLAHSTLDPKLQL